MSVSSFLSPGTQFGVVNADNQFRLLSTTGSNISQKFGTMVSGTTPNLAQLVVSVPGVSPTSMLVITQARNFTTSAYPVGTLTAVVDTTANTITLNSTSASDVGISVAYYIVG
jgi:hypothetical protein